MLEDTRPSRNDIYMAIAELWALRSTCQRGKVGCVIVKDYRIIASGYNGSLPGHLECSDAHCDINVHCMISVHAEANAIAWAAKAGLKVEGCTIFSTHCPCYKCTELIIQAGIRKVYYNNPYPVNGLELFKANGLEVVNFKPELRWSLK